MRPWPISAGRLSFRFAREFQTTTGTLFLFLFLFLFGLILFSRRTPPFLDNFSSHRTSSFTYTRISTRCASTLGSLVSTCGPPWQVAAAQQSGSWRKVRSSTPTISFASTFSLYFLNTAPRTISGLDIPAPKDKSKRPDLDGHVRTWAARSSVCSRVKRHTC